MVSGALHEVLKLFGVVGDVATWRLSLLDNFRFWKISSLDSDMPLSLCFERTSALETVRCILQAVGPIFSCKMLCTFKSLKKLWAAKASLLSLLPLLAEA